MKLFKNQFIGKQKGAALIVLVLAFIMATTVLLISNFTIDKAKVSYEQKTVTALAEAKEALISFAATYHDTSTGSGVPRSGMMGFLPCPEDAGSTGEGRSLGSCGSQYDSYLGRLPWKTLGIEPIKDGSGNCLWFAVSSDYKNSGGLDRASLTNASGLARSEMLNDDSNGSFILYDESLNILKGQTNSDRAIALVIAPGSPVAGQTRTFDNTTQCGGDFNANQFLELFNTKDNSSISTGPGHLIDEFIASKRGLDDAFNDRIITISQSEIWNEIKRRGNFDDLIRNTTQALAACVAQFGLNNPPAGPGCDPVACPGCNINNCRQQCRNDRNTCRNQCDLDRLACLAAGGSNKVCNNARKACRGACDTAETTCLSNCTANCAGGGGGNDYRLPWPAAMDLSTLGEGYRDSQIYVEDNVSGNHLGRYPVDVNITDGITGNSGGQYLLENAYCSAVNTDNGVVNLNTDALTTTGGDLYNSIERRIWQNWKDHFFYAVAGDFDSSNPSTPTLGNCTNCLQSNNNGSFTAIVIFSGERQGVQVRDMQPDTNTKDIIGNYLEGNNATNFPDATGNGNYQFNTVNDVAYCINEDMTVVLCP